MKTATYHTLDGKELKVDYDENAPCIVCGEPVVEASMGGTVICPACDCGRCRYCHETLCGSAEMIKSHVQQCKLNKKAQELAVTPQELADFIKGAKRGLQAAREGKVRPWSEIKKELNID